MSNIPNIAFVSLGCPKALVDSEHIITRLRAEGYEMGDSFEKADLVIINTCGFIDKAIQESMDTIEEAIERNGKVIVTGCLGAKDDRLKQQFPELLALSGPQAADEVLQAVHEHLPPSHDPLVSLVPPQGIKLTPRHYAYLKISEGCNHHCTFCIIPSMRGPLVSRPVGDIMQEAQILADAGVKELLIVAQDTAAYGVDVKYQTSFWNGQPVKTHIQTLAEQLGELGIWIRMHYVYPYPHVDKLVELMADGKILPYLDVPFQHASPRILKAMKRPANSENVIKRVKQWRSICPDISIRSTFITGFPGETDREFDELIDFIDVAALDRVGSFAYSAVEGAAANELGNPVSEEVKLDRQAILMETQAEVSANRLDRLIDSQQTVLLDHIDNENIIGRTRGDAPEVDGTVVIDSSEAMSQRYNVGDFVEVTVNSADEHDLYAEIIT
ncbi:Ribosomal protein S12p Asp88 (E. coli) methylthiotransferase [hydrothermal vent metagenome]|uniref:Ribosomal protein S12p Asp88 (E. coli) methylthiotransferase n=1 Tax=hydrothermal vent metagenome TaxID=652676 RepID=A0A3B0XTL2_9ZZZZ